MWINPQGDNIYKLEMRLPQNIVSDKSDEDGVDPRDHNIVDGGLKIVADISND